MKRIFVGLLFLSIVANIVLGYYLLRTNGNGRRSSSLSFSPFAVTNLVNAEGGEEYIISYENGNYWWTIDGEVISMNAGINQSATVRLDKATGRIKSTTIELLDKHGLASAFTDMNADGIPDKRRNQDDGENWAVFYNGQFVPSIKDGTDRYISKSGTNILIRFDGSRWVEE